MAFGAAPEKLLSRRAFQQLTLLPGESDFITSRAREVADFFKLTVDEVRNLPSVTDKDALESLFTETENDADLLDCYRRASQLYIARLMVRYHRVDKAKALARAVLPFGRRASVVDFGCGSADYSLIFHMLGSDVTLVDIAGGNLDFAEHRFKLRDWPCRAIGVTDDEPHPALPAADLIIAGEVLEHVRDPVATCRYFADSLNPGGLLWISSFPFEPKKPGGDHLDSALQLQAATRKWLETELELVVPRAGAKPPRHYTGRVFRKQAHV